jgi:hypothetical protein
MRNDGPDELDRILDSALASYSERQPWPGIEQRVIARLPRAKQRNVWLRWMIPVPVLAGVLTMVVYWVKPETSRVNVPQRIVESTAPVKHYVQPQPTTVAKKLARVRKSPTVRPVVFPLPSPVTAEERALIQLAAANPEVLENAQVSWQQSNQPLIVEPIDIPPLEKSDSLED